MSHIHQRKVSHDEFAKAVFDRLAIYVLVGSIFILGGFAMIGASVAFERVERAYQLARV